MSHSHPWYYSYYINRATSPEPPHNRLYCCTSTTTPPVLTLLKLCCISDTGLCCSSVPSLLQTWDPHSGSRDQPVLNLSPEDTRVATVSALLHLCPSTCLPRNLPSLVWHCFIHCYIQFPIPSTVDSRAVC
jgi:hypothetical protein